MTAPDPPRRRWDDPSIYRSSASVARRNLEIALGTDGLAAASAVRRLLEDDLPWLEERAVKLSRLEGWSWGLIARRLDRARQSVWSKFRHTEGSPLLPPLRPSSPEKRAMARWRAGRADTRRWQEFDELDPRDVVGW